MNPLNNSLNTVLKAAVATSALWVGAVMADAGQADSQSKSADSQTLRVWQVDYSGRPPFKRSLVEVPVVDAARLESLGVVETRRLRTTDFSGRPPFKRRYQEVRVLDAASLETENVANERPFRNVGFKRRHR